MSIQRYKIIKNGANYIEIGFFFFLIAENKTILKNPQPQLTVTIGVEALSWKMDWPIGWFSCTDTEN